MSQDSAEIITQLAQAIFARYWAGEKLRLLGVGVSRLEPAQSHQLTLGLDV